MKYAEWVHLVPPTASQTWGSAVVELAKLSQRGVPVAPSFALSKQGVKQFFLQPPLRKAVEASLSGAATKRAAKLADVAKDVQKAILKAEIPRALHAELAAYMDLLEQKVLHATGAKLPLELTVYGDDGLPLLPSLWVETSSWKDVASAFTKLLLPLFAPAELALRVRNEQPIVPGIASVVFRYAPEGEYTGTALCLDLAAYDAETIVVELTKGHSKTHTFDTYKFDRKSLVLLSEEKSGKHVTKGAAGKHMHSTPDAGVTLASRVARLAKQAQGDLLDVITIHWTLQGSQLAVTAVSAAEAGVAPTESTFTATLLVKGIGCVPGRVTGKARIIRTEADKKNVAVGDIAVLTMLTQKDASWLHQASGVVIETGHSASIEASLASSFGIVAVSAAHAMLHIREGQLITLDGYRGEVHAGKVQVSVPQTVEQSPVTATKLMTLIEDPLHMQGSSLGGSDGIGLIRGEFLLQLAGLHPHQVYEKQLLEDYREILGEVVERAARFAYPLPVTYQLHDLSEETKGRHRHEPNPKLGYKGSHRIIDEPELVEEEVGVIASLMRTGLTNVRILLPAVRSVGEVIKLHSLIASHWPTGEALPEIWARCAAPSLLIGAHDLCQTGVTGVIFDVPVLAELINGFDGDNHQVGHHLIQDHSAVLDALHFAIATCRSEGVQTSLIAEGYSMEPRVLEEAVEAGVQEVVVPVAEITTLRKLLASIEQRVVLDHARGQGYQHEA
ncbi:phosphoenolpyruvate synthase [soil metagenome]